METLPAPEQPDQSFLDSVLELRERYLQLIQATLTGTIHQDPPLKANTDGNAVYNPEIREYGWDWPSMAYTMVGVKRLQNFRDLIENVIAHHIPGDIVETGVWRGGACILARAVLHVYGQTDRRVILCDSFEGLPAPNMELYPSDAGSTFHGYPELAVGLEEVQEGFRRFNLLDDQVVFVKGFFKDTLPTLPSSQIAVLRLDGDMYESTIQALDSLYDRVSEGGWVIIDDYDVVPACKQAVHDFLDARNLAPEIHMIDGVGRFFQKLNATQAGASSMPASSGQPSQQGASPTAAAAVPQGASESLWDTWPQWESDHAFRTRNFEFIGSVSQFDEKTQGNRIAILKHRQFINIYRELLASRPSRILELGYFQGGMPLFIADMRDPDPGDGQNPLKIVGVDYWPPTEELQQTIANHGLTDTVKLHGGILQDDVAKISAVIATEFGSNPLDLIIDDCSHQYLETKICFEAFFSRLKPGGKYVIEDWGWQHWPGEPWQSDQSPFHGKPSMTNLIHELVMAMASRPDVIARIDVVSEFCTIVTRGPNPAPGEALSLAAITEMAGRAYVPM